MKAGCGTLDVQLRIERTVLAQFHFGIPSAVIGRYGSDIDAVVAIVDDDHRILRVDL